MKKIFIILIFLLISCKHETDTAPVAENTNENEVVLTDAQQKNAGIETTVLTDKAISTVLQVNGKIDVPPQNLVSVSLPMGGYLKSTKLLPGMHVSKGEIIAVIEDQQYIELQQNYLIAKSKLHFASLDAKRQTELNQSQASSDKTTQMAQAEVQNLQLLCNGYAEKLRLIHIEPNNLRANNISKTIYIYATINGFVSKVNVNIGKYINPSEVLFELINPSDIHLNIKVYEKNVSQLKIGQKIVCYTNNEPSKKHNCEIILISKDIAPDGTVEVHCHFEDYDKTLLPGMYMNAEIETQSTLSKTLPEDAIVNFEGTDYVFIAHQKNKYLLTKVTTGEAENGFYSINNANELIGKKIVTKGAYTLLMKMKNTEEE